MNKKLFVGNWKEHKTTGQAREWLNEFNELVSKNPLSENTEIIICPSFALLSEVKNQIDSLRLPIKLGSQDFPAFDEGAFTGEESPHLLKEFVDYAIIGHSERREKFGETDDLLLRKVTLSKQYGIEPIYCIQNDTTQIPDAISIIAYEPVFAIGTGQPDTPENANKLAEEVSKRVTDAIVLYGGSVTDANVSGFLHAGLIQGVLVGSGSLNPQSFFTIVKN